MTVNRLETIKHNGAVRALKDHIQSLKFDLSNVFHATESNTKFCRLGGAIANAELILRAMREDLEELNRLEPGHK